MIFVQDNSTNKFLLYTIIIKIIQFCTFSSCTKNILKPPRKFILPASCKKLFFECAAFKNKVKFIILRFFFCFVQIQLANRKIYGFHYDVCVRYSFRFVNRFSTIYPGPIFMCSAFSKSILSLIATMRKRFFDFPCISLKNWLKKKPRQITVIMYDKFIPS